VLQFVTKQNTEKNIFLKKVYFKSVLEESQGKTVEQRNKINKSAGRDFNSRINFQIQMEM
jgi:hypothetical protein